MFNKNTIIPLSLILLLTACGSDSKTDAEAVDNEPTARTITIIDGYIDEAIICADRNENQICEEVEQIGNTDELGEFSIPVADIEFPTIAKIIAGESNDSDQYGYSIKSYEMIASSDSDVITPFTTVAYKAGISLSELSSTLNIDKDIMSGDYIKAKETNLNEATKVHAIARTFVSIFPETIEEINADSLLVEAFTYVGYIEQYISENGIEALDYVTIQVVDGLPNTKTLHQTLADYLTNSAWSLISTNTSLSQEEGAYKIEFDIEEEDLSLYDANGNLIATTPYLFDGDKLVSTGDVSDEFLLTTDAIAIVKTNEMKDLVIWTKASLSMPLSTQVVTTTMLEGQTFDLIFDDSTNQTPAITRVSFTFSELNGSPEGSVSIVENGETMTGSYYITPEDVIRDELVSDNGILMPINIIVDGQTQLKLHLITSSEGLMVMYDQSHESYSIMTKNIALSDSLMDKF